MNATTYPRNSSLVQPGEKQFNPFRPSQEPASLVANAGEGRRLGNISLCCGLLAPLLVVADILYAFIVMDVVNRPETVIDEITSYVFLTLWITLPIVGLLSTARFCFLYATGRIRLRGGISASFGGSLSLLFAVAMAYVYSR